MAVMPRGFIVCPESRQALRFVFGKHEPGLSPEAVAKQSQRKFVRDNDQLFVYDSERNPTGHVLTALEAYEAFGLDILAEAVEYNSAVILLRVGAIEATLRQQREQLGLLVEPVARAALLSPDKVQQAEANANVLPIQALERVAFALGLDERLLAYDSTAGADAKLAVRLKTLQADYNVGNPRLTQNAVLGLAEAASIVRIQSWLQPTLNIVPRYREFEPSSEYGSYANPAWRIGYNLAEQARERLGLRDEPISSMRKLVEETLGVPVIQVQLPSEIAGATVAVTGRNGREYRGIVLNTIGQNENVWVRRATLAHEIGHLLYDPEDRLERIRVDTYEMNGVNPQGGSTDYVEQRANAFAIAFLAPLGAVRDTAPTPISGESVSKVMEYYGLSLTSAWFHVSNAHYRQYEMPSSYDIPNTRPGDEWEANENFTADYFPIGDTPIQRRGLFAGVVAAAYEDGLISEHTASAYLDCETNEFLDNLPVIRSIYPRHP